MDPDPLLAKLGRILKSADDQDTRALIRAILEAPAVHLAGTGRSGLVVRCFAMRLVELGIRAHVMGEAGTPSCRPGDLLLICSGSGRSPVLIVAAEQALRAGAKLALVTAAVLAPLTRLAHQKVILPPILPGESSPTGKPGMPAQIPDEPGLVSSLRTLFEEATFLYFDSLVPLLMEATGQRPADLEGRRPNLE
jgi:6-phospho-3-hexuloisomerase